MCYCHTTVSELKITKVLFVDRKYSEGCEPRRWNIGATDAIYIGYRTGALRECIETGNASMEVEDRRMTVELL